MRTPFRTMTTAHQIPTRSEIPEADTWDLTHIFKTDADYRNSFSNLRDSYSQIAEFKRHLSEAADKLLSCLELETRLMQITERLDRFASLKNSDDSSDANKLAPRAMLTNLLTKVGE